MILGFSQNKGKVPLRWYSWSVKRAAKRASLSKGNKIAITCAKELYEWIIEQNFKTDFCFVSLKEYDAIQRKMNSRFKKSQIISGTQSYQTFIPFSSSEMIVKQFSNSSVFEKIKIL